MLRIAIVWAICLLAKSLIGGGKDFLIVLVTGLALLSIPVVTILSSALFLENLFKFLGSSRAFVSGVFIAAGVPAILYVLAPNKSNMMADFSGLLKDCLMLGFVWTASYFVMAERLQND